MKWLRAFVFLCVMTGTLCMAQTAKIPFRTIPGSVGATAIGGDGTFVYLAGSGKLQIYDTADPHNPRKVGELSGLPSWECRQLAVHRGYVYITARNRGLWVIDVRDPRNPRKAGDFDTVELATGIDAAGDALFVTMRVYGIQIFDISNPMEPVHAGLYRAPYEAQSTYYRNGILAVGDWGNSSAQLADASHPADLKLLANIPLDGYGDGVYIQGNTLYAATGHHARKGSMKERHGAGHGVELFDISDPAKPERIGGVKFPKFYSLGNDFWSVRRAGKWLAVADTHNGMFLVDIQNPASPEIAGSLKLPEIKRNNGTIPDCVGGIVPGRDVIYIAGSKTGLHVADVPGSLPVSRPDSNLKVRKMPIPPVPGFTRYDCGGMARSAAVSGDFLYVAASDAGLKCFRNTKSGLQELETIRGNRIYDVAVSGSLLVTAGNDSRLTVYRIQKDGRLKQLKEWKSPFPMQVIHLYDNGRTAAISGGTGRLNFVDLGVPEKPVMKQAGFPEQRILYCDAMPERTLNGVFPLNTHGTGLSWYRVNNGKAERIENLAFPKFHQLDGITALGNVFLIPSMKKGYYLLDPADLGKSGLKTELRADAPVSGHPAWNGKELLVFSRHGAGTVSLFNAADPRKLKHIRTIDFHSGTPARAVFLGDRIVIPAGFSGLYVENKEQKTEK